MPTAKIGVIVLGRTTCQKVEIGPQPSIARRLDQLLREVLEEILHEEDRPGKGQPDVGNENGREVVDQPEVAPELEQRDDDDLLGQHEGVDDDDQQHAAEAELEEVEGVGGRRRQQHRRAGRDDRELRRGDEGGRQRILRPDREPGIEREAELLEPPPAQRRSRGGGRIEVTTMPTIGMTQITAMMPTTQTVQYGMRPIIWHLPCAG